MRRSVFGILVSAILATTLASCGGGSGSSTPTTPTPQNAVVSATVTRVTGDRQGTGYVYEVVLQIRESGGIAVTVNSVDLTFFDGGSAYGSTHFDSPMSGDNNQIPANGSASTKTLISTDDRASTPYASRVQAIVRYTDARSAAASATVTADVPALSVPPPTQLFSLSGTVLEVPGNFPVRSALVEIKTGTNAGAALFTDASGKFTFSALTAGSLTLAVSKSEYDAAQQTVNLASNATVTLNVRKAAAPPPPAPPPSLCAPASAACGAATARCNDGTLSCSQNRSGTCSSHGGVQCFICPGLLCSGATTQQELPFTPASLPYTPAQPIRYE